MHMVSIATPTKAETHIGLGYGMNRG